MDQKKIDLLKKVEGDKYYKTKRLFKKFKYAFQGIIHAVIEDTSFVTHITIAFIVCIFCFIFDLTATEIMFVLSAIFFVLISELINTAIEESINLFTTDIKRGAMVAKDAAAGAVLLASIYSVLIGIIVFGPKVYIFFRSKI
ncbi:MAG TPA: diacylglycerol kinase family protein [bacterium]|jgi:undecaprenol kinase|nr:diacylglycerol kinase family protein [Bacteroidales bacterium]HOC96248.1 diacylglycerol kinase family protein [bacterium]HPO11260.1 diacylglycerol kinase family protein [bacterium]HQL11413.1 diacylglycerol kinase family protein [bacterium]